MHRIWLVTVISLSGAIINLAWNQRDLKVVFCDVGQGDATLVLYHSFQMLVDGGPNDTVLDCLGHHMPFFDRHIELVVATHQDADHITGLSSVLDSYRVEQLVWNGEEKETADFLAFNQAIQREQREGMRVVLPSASLPQVVDENLMIAQWFPRVAKRLSSARLSLECETLLQDNNDDNMKKQKEPNDGSIVTFVEFGGVSLLLMGDLETKGELTLNCLGLLKPTTIVKVGHHGSKTSSSEAFVGRTKPEYSVFSVGKNNRFKHPSPEVMSRYDAVGSTSLRTDLLGSVVLLSDGSRVWREKTLINLLFP